MQLKPELKKVIIHENQNSNPAIFNGINNNIYLHVFKDGRVTNVYIQTVSNGTFKELLKDWFVRKNRNADYSGTSIDLVCLLSALSITSAIFCSYCCWILFLFTQAFLAIDVSTCVKPKVSNISIWHGYQCWVQTS